MTLKKAAMVAAVGMGAVWASGEWRVASVDDRAIEMRVSRPARNSCEIAFRDLALRSKTSFTAVIQYLPHAAAKRGVETDTVEVVIGAGKESEHIGGCEAVVSVGVSGVVRR